MILAILLFGLNLDPLYESIAAVESTNGKTSANVYQITPAYVGDCNRFMSCFKISDRFSPFKSRFMMEVYWTVYGKRYFKATGKQPTYETLARIHNGGPDGWKKRATVHYWKRVKTELAKRGVIFSHVAP